ncbi:hypothetical protein PQQ88_31490 [Paraburkholderia caledonica]|uniref:hypothetical protein n=1 Tax=Paraburkholderia caledonica TaxID=134536 RepID=UPI0038BB6E2C
MSTAQNAASFNLCSVRLLISRFSDLTRAMADSQASMAVVWSIVFARTSPESQGQGSIFFDPRRYWRALAGGPVGVVIAFFLKSAAAVVSKQYQEQTASLQTALLPETYRAGHDMSRTGEPYLKTGEQARGDKPRAMMTRQQNRRVLLPFGPTSSCYRVEQ